MKPAYANATFTVSGHTATMPMPGPGYEVQPKLAQFVGETAGGADVVYDKAAVRYRISATFVCTNAEKVAFCTWFYSYAQGALNAFTYRDHFGNSYASCRFASGEVKATKTAAGRWTIPLEFSTPSVAA